MKEEIKSLYSQKEQLLLTKLDKLFVEWQKRWDGENGWFIRDGFYPGYLGSRKKILFFARDCYDMYELADEDYGCYISTFIPQYAEGLLNGPNGRKKSINGVKFHKLLIQVAYGILQGDNAPLAWSDIPYARDICETGQMFRDVSFGFMELGKLSHESCDPAGTGADWEKISTSVSFSTNGDNLLRREIDLLAPDLIIGMNLNDNPDGKDYYSIVFGKDISKAALEISDCSVYQIHLTPKKSIPLLDCWHFSGRFSEEKYIWEPICEALAALNFYQ